MFFDKVVYYWSSSKLTFILFMVNLFFWLIHFLLVESYELPKITSRVLSVPLNLKCVRILSWFISYFFYLSCFLMMFCVRLLSELMIMLSTIHVTHIWLVATSSNLIFKIWKYNIINIRKCNSACNDILTFGKLFRIYKLIHPYQLKMD